MKATEQYFSTALFIMLYKVVLTFESVDEILKYDHSKKATEQYFPMAQFVFSIFFSPKIACKRTRGHHFTVPAHSLQD